MEKYYTGIGSRQTPKNICSYMEVLGSYFAKQGYILRSGHAEAADESFENGCDRVGGEKEIYLPWKNFRDSNSKLVVIDKKAFDIAKKFHPFWHSLKPQTKNLHARNSHQILGINLDTPSEFVLCWTKNGSGSGGTGQALRIANEYNIPIFDLGTYGEDICIIKKEIKLFFNQINLFL